MSTTSDQLEKFNYQLPEERIAKRPLEKRDASKLIVYKNGVITHQSFRNIVDFIPKNATIFLNNTKVIAARLYFFKSTGAKIEVFLTEPLLPHGEIVQALKAKNKCEWKCIIGNLKKWKDGEILSIELDHFQLTASLKNRVTGEVEFTWPGDFEFLEVIESAGHVPLPPYMNRPDDSEDKSRYQTVFSELEGAVAAPTAGLHFTDEILHQLSEKGVKKDTLTLHVSAGTFRPIKSENYQDHEMHNEKIIVHKRNIENLLDTKGPIVAIGTTALRTLESIYWYGASLLVDPTAPFFIKQTDPYAHEHSITSKQALEAVLTQMNTLGTEVIQGQTEIYIYPGYEFKIVDALSTNFHMPGSTLILLVASFVGEDWRKIYDEALKNNYRFLSYGDTSLLFRK